MINLPLMNTSMMSQTKICKKNQVNRSETTIFQKKIVSFLVLLTFSLLKYMDPFLLYLITKKSKIRGVLSYCYNTLIVMYNLLFS